MTETKPYNPQRFHHFLAHMTRLVDRGPSESDALSGASEFLHDLISHDDWLLEDFAQPHPQHYQQYLLFADPADRFSVVSFVWGPGQSTPIHDHTVWGLIGMLRGSEMCQPYSKMSDGRWAAAGIQIQMLPGDIECVSPRLGDVHKVWNTFKDQVSISIHIYGANIGKVKRNVYYEDGTRKTFISGYSNVPQLFSGLVTDAEQVVQEDHGAAALSQQSSSGANVQTSQTATKPSPTNQRVTATELSDESSPSKLPPLAPGSHSMSVASNTAFYAANFKGKSAQGGQLQTQLQARVQENTIVDKVNADSASNNSTHSSPIHIAKFANSEQLDFDEKTENVVESVLGPQEFDGFTLTTAAQVRNHLLSKNEIALIDVREEDPYAQSHPLFACNMPIGRIQADAYRRIPRKDTLVVVYDNSEGLAVRAANLLKSIGYSQVTLLEGGLSGWAAFGGELFRDVNVPSKAFGESVESIKHTPSLGATEVKALIEQKADVVVLDARRFDEYQTMSIPGAMSVPGAELALRARTIAPNPSTRIIVNCAGRTRSIIGAQSLINAGIPNPVCALRNGTIGWMLAGQELVKGGEASFPSPKPEDLSKAKASALALAFRSGLKRIDLDEYLTMRRDTTRTTYLFDVRTPQEFMTSSLEGAHNAPGGQLVQETDHSVAVRGARIVLFDTEGVRAHMTGSWLAQMGWEVYVIKDVQLSDLRAAAQSKSKNLVPALAEPVEEVSAEQLKEWLANRINLTLVIDVGESIQYVKRHIPGAWWILRSQLAQDFSRIHKANRYVLTCADGVAARFAVADLKALVRPGVQVMCLTGGNASWFERGFSTQQGESYVVSPRIDRYRRPYEGTENAAQAMQAYLDWEFGLVEQLRRDGTHGFKVI